MKQAKDNKNGHIVLLEPVRHRLREGGLICMLGLTLYLFLALLSYYPTDPGWSQTALAHPIHNITGQAGAYFADIFLCLFGYLAYLFPFTMCYMALVQLCKQDSITFNMQLFLLRLLGFFTILTTTTGLAGLAFRHWEGVLPFSSGGMLGEMVAMSLVRLFNPVGGALLLLVLLLAGVTLLTGLSWLNVVDRVGQLSWDVSIRCYYFFKTTINKIKQHFEERAKTIEKISPPIVKKEPRITISNPIQIKDKIEKITPSARAERDKQVPLFETNSSKELPSLSLLDRVNTNKRVGYSKERLEAMSRELELRLQDFNINAEVVEVHPGPVITRFEIQLAAGLKVSKISTLIKDLARSMSVQSVRIVEIIPGKSTVGIEIPNENREVVQLSEVLSSQQYEQARSPLSLALGKDIAGHPVIVDIAKMPHLLVAGTTGAGKSVSLNAMLLSLLYKATPDEVRLIMIDPKMLELSVYDGIPHLLTPVVTDMKEAANALRWCVAEMERRYRLMASLGVRNLSGFNSKITEAKKANEPLKDPFWTPSSNEETHPELEELPFIVVLVDEFADMMMVVGKKVEELIARIAQKARAAGIHLILATQRPSVDVITGLIKANVPTRIAFQVSSRVDSRTIIDQQGAEQLLGHGDMLYLPPGTSIPVRVHGAFVDDHEVHKVVADWKKRSKPIYINNILDSTDDVESSNGTQGTGEQDELYDQAVEFVTTSRKVSISSVQRRFRIGYNRAACIVEEMERAGVVSTMESNGSREVLAPPPVE